MTIAKRITNMEEKKKRVQRKCASRRRKEYRSKEKSGVVEDEYMSEFGMSKLNISTRRLSGVMDDRGKYIYISPEEMKAVADYIKRQGRVSISHLASKSNQFIDLEPKAAQFADEIAGAEEIVAT